MEHKHHIATFSHRRFTFGGIFDHELENKTSFLLSKPVRPRNGLVRGLALDLLRGISTDLQVLFGDRR
jgi:hypothetical protein